jgi:hypothetical protein
VLSNWLQSPIGVRSLDRNAEGPAWLPSDIDSEAAVIKEKASTYSSRASARGKSSKHRDFSVMPDDAMTERRFGPEAPLEASLASARYREVLLSGEFPDVVTAVWEAAAGHDLRQAF